MLLKRCWLKLARWHAEVVAVGSRSKEKAASYIKEVEGADGALAYGSYEEVLDEPSVQAVYIPLPTSMHLEWVQKAAAKGKHVLLEKPIAMVREENALRSCTYCTADSCSLATSKPHSLPFCGAT